MNPSQKTGLEGSLTVARPGRRRSCMQGTLMKIEWLYPPAAADRATVTRAAVC
jgi:hypothetical protein